MTARRLERYLGRPIGTASTEDIERWLDTLTVTPQTRSHYRGDLVSFFSWSIRNRKLRHDPTDAVERTQRPKYLPRPMNDEDLALALARAYPKMRMILAFAAFAGLRAAEVAALTVDDLDRRLEVLYIRQGKGAKDRVVAISSALAFELDRFEAPRRGPVIATLKGQHYQAGSISSLVCTYLRSLGIEASLHQGRHYCATEAYRGTGDLRAVQELLGHATIQQTALYTKVTGVETRAAVEAVAHPLG